MARENWKNQPHFRGPDGRVIHTFAIWKEHNHAAGFIEDVDLAQDENFGLINGERWIEMSQEEVDQYYTKRTS